MTRCVFASVDIEPGIPHPARDMTTARRITRQNQGPDRATQP